VNLYYVRIKIQFVPHRGRIVLYDRLVNVV